MMQSITLSSIKLFFHPKAFVQEMQIARQHPLEQTQEWRV